MAHRIGPAATACWLLFSVFSTGVSAAPVEHDQVLLHDPASDVQIEGNGITPQDAPPGYEHVDLLGARLAWDGDAVLVELRLAETHSPDRPGTDAAAFGDQLRSDEVRIQASKDIYLVDVVSLDAGRIRSESGDSVGMGESYVDESTGTWGVRVPAEFLFSDAGKASAEQRVTWAGAEIKYVVAITPIGAGWHAVDRIPADDTAFISRPAADLRLGEILIRPDPGARFSNGGSELMVFGASLSNPGKQAAAVELRPAELPDGWSMTTPGAMDVAAGQDVWVPVIVRSTGNHQHGSTAVAVAEARSSGLVQPILFATDYLTLPQPAGHHDRLYLHSYIDEGEQGTGFGGGEARWTNTLQTDPDATDEPLAARSSGTLAAFVFPLQRGLDLGLDFRSDEPVVGEARFVTVVDGSTPVSATARLLYCQPGWEGEAHRSADADCPQGKYRLIAEDTTALSGSYPVTAAFSMPVATWADSIPPRPGATLRIEVELRTEEPVMGTGAQPRLDPASSWFELPLNEYRDWNTTTGALDLHLAAAAREAGAGSRLVVPYTVDNLGEVPLGVRVQALDASGWVHDAPRDVRVAGQASVGGDIVVDIPEDATVGDVADIAVVAWTDDGAAVRPLRVTVSEAAAVEEAPTGIAGKGSPGPGTAIVLAGLVGGLAFTMRRKR